MHGFSDTGVLAESSASCNLHNGVSAAEYTVDGQSSDTNCFDSNTVGSNLELSTNLVFYDANGNRPWSSVSNQLN